MQEKQDDYVKGRQVEVNDNKLNLLVIANENSSKTGELLLISIKNTDCLCGT